MNDNLQLEEMIQGKEKHYSEKGFNNTLKKFGKKLGFKGMHTAATLYCAVKSPDMPKHNKLIIFGALGYFILPFDVVADFLPMVGLTDDLFVITTALSKVYLSITDDMKQDAHQLLKKKLGDRYDAVELDDK